MIEQSNLITLEDCLREGLPTEWALEQAQTEMRITIPPFQQNFVDDMNLRLSDTDLDRMITDEELALKAREESLIHSAVRLQHYKWAKSQHRSASKG